MRKGAGSRAVSRASRKKGASQEETRFPFTCFLANASRGEPCSRVEPGELLVHEALELRIEGLCLAVFDDTASAP